METSPSNPREIRQDRRIHATLPQHAQLCRGRWWFQHAQLCRGRWWFPTFNNVSHVHIALVTCACSKLACTSFCNFQPGSAKTCGKVLTETVDVPATAGTLDTGLGDDMLPLATKSRRCPRCPRHRRYSAGLWTRRRHASAGRCSRKMRGRGRPLAPPTQSVIHTNQDETQAPCTNIPHQLRKNMTVLFRRSTNTNTIVMSLLARRSNNKTKYTCYVAACPAKRKTNTLFMTMLARQLTTKESTLFMSRNLQHEKHTFYVIAGPTKHKNTHFLCHCLSGKAPSKKYTFMSLLARRSTNTSTRWVSWDLGPCG